MRIPSLSALLVLSLAACDPAAVSDTPAATPGKVGAAPGKTEAGKPEAGQPAGQPAAGEPAAGQPVAPPPVYDTRNVLHECLTACDTAKLSATDRATCRMNCGPSPVDAATGPAADGGVGEAARCFSACHAGKPGDVKACGQSCVTAGAKVANSPGQAVLEQLGTCVAECHADKTLSATDRETCKLTCEQVASTAGPAGK